MRTTSVPAPTTVLGAMTVADGPPLGAGADPPLIEATVPSDAVELAKKVLTVFGPEGVFGLELPHVTLLSARAAQPAIPTDRRSIGAPHVRRG